MLNVLSAGQGVSYNGFYLTNLTWLNVVKNFSTPSFCISFCLYICPSFRVHVSLADFLSFSFFCTHPVLIGNMSTQGWCTFPGKCCQVSFVSAHTFLPKIFNSHQNTSSKLTPRKVNQPLHVERQGTSYIQLLK